MVNDSPTVIRKQSISKTGWYEKPFLSWFNRTFATCKLLSCSQDFSTFDYWMLDSNQTSPPKLIELKAHPNKLHTDRDFVGCDLIKLLKLRSLSFGHDAKIFHIFEDVCLIQDINTEITRYVETVWGGHTVLLALVPRLSCEKQLTVGLRDLKNQQTPLLSDTP